MKTLLRTIPIRIIITLTTFQSKISLIRPIVFKQCFVNRTKSISITTQSKMKSGQTCIRPESAPMKLSKITRESFTTPNSYLQIPSCPSESRTMVNHQSISFTTSLKTIWTTTRSACRSTTRISTYQLAMWRTLDTVASTLTPKIWVRTMVRILWQASRSVWRKIMKTSSMSIVIHVTIAHSSHWETILDSRFATPKTNTQIKKAIVKTTMISWAMDLTRSSNWELANWRPYNSSTKIDDGKII